jgi:hypothetical protein
MQLNQEQIRQLLRTHGVYLNQACDRCGAILGAVRWTIRNEQGEWCSQKCRDGVDYEVGVCRGCGTSMIGKRKGAIYCDRTCRMRSVRRQVRDSANIVNAPIQNTGLANAISAFGCVGTRESDPVQQPSDGS